LGVALFGARRCGRRFGRISDAVIDCALPVGPNALTEPTLVAVLDAIPDCVQLLDCTGRVRWLNHEAMRLRRLGETLVLADDWQDCWPAEQSPDAARALALAGIGQPACFIARGWEVTISMLNDASGRLLAISRSTTATGNDANDQTPRMAAQDRALADRLAHVCLQAERTLPRLRCAVMLADAVGTLRCGAAPSLPHLFIEAAAQCLVAATGPQAEDIALSERWLPARRLARQHGLRACWQTPLQAGGTRLGSFVVYHGKAGGPDDEQRRLLARFAELAALVVDQTRARLVVGTVPEPAAPPHSASTIHASAGRILLVDDDELVRPVIAVSLQDSGYQVLEAADAEAALALIRSEPRFELLISDVVMPGMDGPTMVAQLRRERSTLPVLFITGHSAEHTLAGERVLRKPFTNAELANAVLLALAR
jgi:CheY-like chemotaxis protein